MPKWSKSNSKKKKKIKWITRFKAVDIQNEFELD